MFLKKSWRGSREAEIKLSPQQKKKNLSSFTIDPNDGCSCSPNIVFLFVTTVFQIKLKTIVLGWNKLLVGKFSINLKHIGGGVGWGWGQGHMQIRFIVESWWTIEWASISWAFLVSQLCQEMKELEEGLSGEAALLWCRLVYMFIKDITCNTVHYTSLGISGVSNSVPPPTVSLKTRYVDHRFQSFKVHSSFWKLYVVTKQSQGPFSSCSRAFNRIVWSSKATWLKNPQIP